MSRSSESDTTAHNLEIHTVARCETNNAGSDEVDGARDGIEVP